MLRAVLCVPWTILRVVGAIAAVALIASSAVVISAVRLLTRPFVRFVRGGRDGVGGRRRKLVSPPRSVSS